MDEEKKQYQVIRQDLIRSVITEPLLTEIQEPGDGLMDVIIDVNLQYQGGREQAFQAVREIAVEALAAIGQAGAEGMRMPDSVGSSSNPDRKSVV